MKTTLEERIMANVGVIYFIRKMISLAALECYVLAASVIGTSLLVSVPHVLKNMESVGLFGAAPFFEAAFLHTHLIVQCTAALAAAAFALLASGPVLHFFRRGLRAFPLTPRIS